MGLSANYDPAGCNQPAARRIDIHSWQSRWLRLVIVCVFFSSSFSRIASSLHLRLFIAADSVLFYYKELCNWWNVIFVKFNCVGLPYGGVCIPPMCVAMATLFYLCKRRGLDTCVDATCWIFKCIRWNTTNSGCRKTPSGWWKTASQLFDVHSSNKIKSWTSTFA